jgi:transcriptional regulator with XRE-family HTH domain
MNFEQIFKVKMDSWGISGKELAAASGRSVTGISQIRTGHSSPSIADFQKLLDICDELRPGFKADYLNSLSTGKPDLKQLVYSLSSTEFGMLLHIAAQRVQDRVPVAIAS